MKSVIRTLGFLVSLFAVAKIAMALELPAQGRFEAKIDSKQYGYTNWSVSDEGKVRVATKFSNGKKVDGDHFHAAIVFYGPDKRAIAGVLQNKGLSAAGFGSAKEGTVVTVGLIAPELARQIERVEIRYRRVDKIDDEKFWDKVTTLVQVAYGSGFAVFGLGTELD